MFDEVYDFLLEVFDRVKPIEGGILMVSGDEGGRFEGQRALDYWTSSRDYDLGVYIPFAEELESMGFYVEWYDAGTAYITPF